MPQADILEGGRIQLPCGDQRPVLLDTLVAPDMTLLEYLPARVEIGWQALAQRAPVRVTRGLHRRGQQGQSAEETHIGVQRPAG
ncbi:hypothetical protein D3C71_2105790 [compost metagenome]